MFMKVQEGSESRCLGRKLKKDRKDKFDKSAHHLSELSRPYEGLLIINSLGSKLGLKAKKLCTETKSNKSNMILCSTPWDWAPERNTRTGS